MEFIKQCKGTDSDTVPNLDKYWDKQSRWFWSIKYDGQYAQIHISKDGFVIFYTSSGKPYTNDILAKELLENIPCQFYPIVLEAEYLGTGDGRLGGRSDAAVVTTLRTAFAKGINVSMEHRIRVFDIIRDEPFAYRLCTLQGLNYTNMSDLVSFVTYEPCETIEDAQHIRDLMIAGGYEGIYCKSADHIQEAGKRVKTAFKFKKKNETIVTIIGIDEGTGKYEGQIGAFICRDGKGMLVNVGSGLTDSIRALDPKSLIGKQIRINYERIDQTYIFPIFIDFIQIQND